jgi:serine/threonine-protein kinase
VQALQRAKELRQEEARPPPVMGDLQPAQAAQAAFQASVQRVKEAIKRQPAEAKAAVAAAVPERQAGAKAVLDVVPGCLEGLAEAKQALQAEVGRWDGLASELAVMLPVHLSAAGVRRAKAMLSRGTAGRAGDKAVAAWDEWEAALAVLQEVGVEIAKSPWLGRLTGCPLVFNDATEAAATQWQELLARERKGRRRLAAACQAIKDVEPALLCTARRLWQVRQLTAQQLAHVRERELELLRLQDACRAVTEVPERIAPLKAQYKEARQSLARRKREVAFAQAYVDNPDDGQDLEQLQDDLQLRQEALCEARRGQRSVLAELHTLYSGPAPELALQFPVHVLHGTEAFGLVVDRCLDDYGKRTQLSSAGANHVVWEAVDPDTKLACVLKEFKSSDPRKWLRRQAHVMARLQHPNLLPVQAIFREAGGHFYVQSPFLSGGTLDRWMQDCGNRPLVELRQIVRGLLLGLHYLHAEGVIHRDLKPGNVVLTSQGQSVLIDFEHSVDPTLATLRTGAGLTLAGTVGFLAPELLQGQPATAASDVYALGKMVEELCRAWERTLPEGEAGNAPSELYAVAKRMMSNAPGSRPTAMDLLATPLLSRAWGAEQEGAEAVQALQHLQTTSAMRRMVRVNSIIKWSSASFSCCMLALLATACAGVFCFVLALRATYCSHLAITRAGADCPGSGGVSSGIPGSAVRSGRSSCPCCAQRRTTAAGCRVAAVVGQLRGPQEAAERDVSRRAGCGRRRSDRCALPRPVCRPS